MSKERNPYEANTPEWQLYQNWAGLVLEADAHDADAARSSQKAEACRVKATKYLAALEKLKA